MVGGADLQLLLGRSDEYLGLQFKTSLKGWHQIWFYVANLSPSLPTYVGRRPVVRNSCNSLPLAKEMEQVNALLGKLKACNRDDGVNGVSVVINFHDHRIQPIKERVHPAYKYTGAKDMTQESAEKWKAGTLSVRVASLFQCDVDVDVAERPEGFHLGNPPDKVCLLLPNFVFSVF